MKIVIETIPHNQQRYDTVGDWWDDENGVTQIRVSHMGNHIYEWLVAEHEINEKLRCEQLGITEKQVSDFDIAFEKLRKEYPDLIGEQEPGDMVSAPYHEPHVGATRIEKVSAIEKGVNWEAYNNAVESL